MKYSNFLIFALLIISRILYSMDYSDPSLDVGPYPNQDMDVGPSRAVEVPAHLASREVVINIRELQQLAEAASDDSDSDDELGPALAPEQRQPIDWGFCAFRCALLTIAGGALGGAITCIVLNS